MSSKDQFIEHREWQETVIEQQIINEQIDFLIGEQLSENDIAPMPNLEDGKRAATMQLIYNAEKIGA